MTPHPQEPHAELASLCGSVRDGNLTAEQFARLQEILAESAEAREFYVQFLQLHTWFTRQAAGELEVTSVARAADVVPAIESSPVPADVSLANRPRRRWQESCTAFWARYGSPLTIAALLLLMLGFWSSRREVEELRGVLAARSSGDQLDVAIAYLAVANGCSWGGGDMPVVRKIGAAVEIGDELTLHEGIAEFRLTSGVYLSIEGPAAVVLTSPSALMLRYGKVTVNVPDTAEVFKALTPACRITARNAECGLTLLGDNLEVHVFDGEVRATNSLIDPEADELLLASEGGTVISNDDGVFSKAVVTAGRALLLTSESELLKVSKWGRAVPQLFATKLPLSGPLPVTEVYADAVMGSKPIGYWRFESLQDGIVENEISGGTSLKLSGDSRLTEGPRNRAMQFDFSESKSILVSEAPIGLPANSDYTLEAWVKPSYFHRGEFLALMAHPEEELGHHAVLLETIGHSGTFGTRYPFRFRYLHRDPPSRDVTKGMSAFSWAPYQVRRWQHVAAHRRGDFMRLYVNGKLAAKGEFAAGLVSDLHLVVRWPGGVPVRYFVGELDEVAVYDRALSTKEIAGHYQSVVWTAEEVLDDST